MTPVTESKHLNKRTISQVCCTFIHTHTLTQILFRQLNSNISLTLYLTHTLLYTMHESPRPINIFLRPKRKVYVATFTEIRVFAMLLSFVLGK